MSSEHNHHFVNDSEEDQDEDSVGNIRVNEDSSEQAQQQQPNLEQIQRVYYMKGLEELESLQLFDLSPLANWKLSSYKPGFGLSQLRDDSPDTYWQSDGSNQGTNTGNNFHSITIQFSKKVSLERISLFTNYSLDESYTPCKIKIMAGNYDLIDVCTVNFNQPIGWSHIIFNGIRSDGVLKCFNVKLIILANHQEGKDSHIRAIRCFGKKSGTGVGGTGDSLLHHHEILKDISMASGSTSISESSKLQVEEDSAEAEEEVNTSNVLSNVSHVVGYNTGFQSFELKSISSIR
ncbi:Anaphase-promoting complex subunit 10 [Spathaspora sp. JA1]|nr:Anaphase-promoting complex subunit 10 [Spathaspora sp. JA1]